MPTSMVLEQIASYPVEDRVIIADAIIESLNGVKPDIDSAWGAAARRRLGELKARKVRGVAASAVFARARTFCKA